MSALPRPRVSIDLLRAANELALELKRRFKKMEGASSIQAAAVPNIIQDSVTWEIQISYVRPSIHRLPLWVDRVPKTVPFGEYVIPVSVRCRN